MAATRVAICDDSRTYATALALILEAGGAFEVVGRYATAEDLLAALPSVRADLVTMDIELPGLDGVDATREIMRSHPTPVVVLSSHVERGSRRVAEALAAGAVDALHKGDVALGDATSPAAAALRRRLGRLSRLRVGGPTARAVAAPRRTPPTDSATVRAAKARGVAAVGVAASTGGPAALRAVLEPLPAEPAVPILVVQHITAGFTEGLAHWLDTTVSARVRLATSGMRLTPGVWLAPEAADLLVADGLRLVLDHAPPPGPHVPSADALFCSMARSLGARAAVVVLTGMGTDGAAGVRAVIEKGGLAVAQDEPSSAVPGMPRAAVAAGAQVVLGVSAIGELLAALPRERGRA